MKKLPKGTVWIDNYEGLYAVDEVGLIISFHKDPNGRILKPTMQNGGYLLVCLRKYGKKKYQTVHRLILESFFLLGKHLEVNHLNGKKIDNRLCNLEWLSSRENHLHAIRNGLTLVGRKGICGKLIPYIKSRQGKPRNRSLIKTNNNCLDIRGNHE